MGFDTSFNNFSNKLKDNKYLFIGLLGFFVVFLLYLMFFR